jgi:catechol 2,3-dioxygenase-like lactoylglutathione lyase family enzyme
VKGRPIVFVPSANPRLAARWYVAKLGMRHVGEDAFAAVVRDDAITIRLSLSENVEPAPYAILGWEVADRKKAMRQLKAKRVRLLRYPGIGQRADGTWKSPAGAQVVWFADRDGNVLSITQRAR